MGRKLSNSQHFYKITSFSALNAIIFSRIPRFVDWIWTTSLSEAIENALSSYSLAALVASLSAIVTLSFSNSSAFL